MSNTSPPSIFRWEDVLGVAIDLSKLDDEASLRSSVSRSYYFAFNLARVKVGLVPPLGSPPQPDAHRKCWDAISSRFGPAIAKTARALRDRRNNADYDLLVPAVADWKGTAQSAIAKARKIASSL
jgi:hypothetical protein